MALIRRPAARTAEEAEEKPAPKAEAPKAEAPKKAAPAVKEPEPKEEPVEFVPAKEMEEAVNEAPAEEENAPVAEAEGSVGELVALLVDNLYAGKGILIQAIDGGIAIRVVDGSGVPVAPTSAVEQAANGGSTGGGRRKRLMKWDDFIRKTATPEYLKYVDEWGVLEWDELVAKAKKKFGLVPEEGNPKIVRIKFAQAIQDKLGITEKWKAEYRDPAAREKVLYG